MRGFSVSLRHEIHWSSLQLLEPDWASHSFLLRTHHFAVHTYIHCSITHTVQGNSRKGYFAIMKLTRGVPSTQTNKHIYFNTLRLFTFMSSSVRYIYIYHLKKQPAESNANPHFSLNFELRRWLQTSCSARRDLECPNAFVCASYFYLYPF